MSTATIAAPASEQSRARYPDETGCVERDGVRVFWERYGEGEPTVMLLPAWSIVHSRCWKAQIPYLARHARVLTFDPRGNGRSDRPVDPAAYAEPEFAADALAVLDATDTDHAFLVGWSMGAQRALLLAAEHPQRVDGVVFVGPAVPLGEQSARAAAFRSFDQRRDLYTGWEKYNRHYWLEHYEDFLQFFLSQVFTEPHCTKQLEDAVGWGLDTTPETLIATEGRAPLDEQAIRRLAAGIRCPVLVVHGTEDAIRSSDSGAALATLLGAEFVSLVGSGHAPHARDPVRMNLLLRDFVCPPGPAHRWRRGAARRPRRTLYVSSPIGLGHARRDLAIARELRALVPELEIEWLAQDPVTQVLEEAGERIHPASGELASESAHIAAEATDGHALACFQALRRMDEILLANFMVFHDVVRDEPYDLWIGDEAWDLDHFLHENPELKTAPYAWLTDFVGYLPMPEGGEREAALTADYNAEMLEHIARYPWVRDRSIFVGEPADVVPDQFGPGLPRIREWTERHYRFSGYVTGFHPTEVADRGRLRAELGYGPDERVCLVAVGGSGVGGELLLRVIAALPEARRLVPDLRMVVVTGPRIDPSGWPSGERLEVRTYVPDLHRHLAACDLALVQGGLTTAMELTASRRPFIYFPLRGHFEQNLHVRHRLERYRAGRRMDFESATPDAIATAIAQEIGREVDYLPVATDGAARAAALLAELL